MPSIKFIMLMVTTLMLGACSTDAQLPPQIVKIEQLQHDWTLTHIDNIQVAKVINSSLKISKENKATGSLGCNRFFGQAEFDNNKLRIAQMGSSRKMCGEIENNVEMDVSQILSEWATVMINNETLIISNKKHSLTYKLANPTL